MELVLVGCVREWASQERPWYQRGKRIAVACEDRQRGGMEQEGGKGAWCWHGGWEGGVSNVSGPTNSAVAGALMHELTHERNQKGRWKVKMQL